MHNFSPTFFFYVPSPRLIESVPATIDGYWDWINEVIKTSPAALAKGGGPCTWVGPYNWTIQTFIYLKTYGFPCQLTASIPDEGIIITHGDFLPKSLKAKPKQFIVEIKPDRSFQCTFANYVIVQNRHDPIRKGIKRILIKSAVVNYWPQPGLIPRDPNRGNRFENICYMGNPEQFIQDINLLESEIKKLGLNWSMVPRERWHDYREVDAIVAVREINTQMRIQRDDTSAIFSPQRKPASKLYNAWRAGVPAILSPDIAFEDNRKSDLDYIRAQNIPEIIKDLKRLREDPQLRKDMVENGKRRVEEFTPEKTVQTWVDVIKKQILPSYHIWKGGSIYRKLFFITRSIAYKYQLME